MNASTLVSLCILAAAAAASPFSLIVFSLVLATDRGARNGVAFMLGWITTVVLIGVVVFAIGGAVDVTEKSTPREWFLALQLALGVVLIIFWLRRRLRQPSERVLDEVVPDKPQPGWQRRIAGMRYPGSFVLGGMTQTWPVMIAAAAQIALLSIGTPAKITWILLFAIVTTTGIVMLEVLAIRSPGSAAGRLDRIRLYVDLHRDSVVNWALLLGGLWLAFRALIELISN